MIELPTKGTIGEIYGPAMAITDQREADEYFEALVSRQLKLGSPRSVAESVERKNLGYYAGYYDNETQKRVQRLFRCQHPIFGKAAGP